MIERHENAPHMRARRKLVKKLHDKGLNNVQIMKKLKKIREGQYSASLSVIRRDVTKIEKQRKNWHNQHDPHQIDVFREKRQKMIDELEGLIKLAKIEGKYKTAGDLIAKKARLEGVDKYIAPKEKKKDKLEEKYKGKTQKEVNEILLNEFKDLSASLIRMARKDKLDNISNIIVKIVRKEKDKKVKYTISRYGEEKFIVKENQS